jgi:hypothetical protein
METLRKMMLAMATDMSGVDQVGVRVTTLRYFAECKREDSATQQYASETMNLYAPLANRLGVWQLKWELEDLSFRFLEPAQYKRIAKMLEEKRVERESFVATALARLTSELKNAGIKGEVSGRPKHIYSIWKKMKGKSVNFDELYDVRAFRVVVDDIKDCYTVLGLVHNVWAPIPKEFDDYISAQNRTVINLCIQSLLLRMAGHLRYRFVRKKCTSSRNMESLRIGVIKRVAALTSRHKNMTKKLPGCDSYLPGKVRLLMRLLSTKTYKESGWKS